jgi:hydrogenase-4 membrane subunit HyfE
MIMIMIMIMLMLMIMIMIYDHMIMIISMIIMIMKILLMIMIMMKIIPNIHGLGYIHTLVMRAYNSLLQGAIVKSGCLWALWWSPIHHINAGVCSECPRVAGSCLFSSCLFVQTTFIQLLVGCYRSAHRYLIDMNLPHHHCEIST